MKKVSLFLIAILFLCTSCEKTPVKKWGRFYGFTQADVIGHYNANTDESQYQELPTEGIAVYDNVSIDVTPIAETAISVHIIIPGIINKTFSGPLNMLDENRSDITLTTIINSLNKEDIWMTVYKNDQGQVRFHGRVKRYYFIIDDVTHQTILDHSDNWGFDVIKEE